MSKAKRVFDALVRLAILGGFMLGADVLALVLFAAGVSATGIILAMAGVGLAGIWAGGRATTPNGSLPVGGALRHESAPKSRQPQN
jgi:hypothetical protein